MLAKICSIPRSNRSQQKSIFQWKWLSFTELSSFALDERKKKNSRHIRYRRFVDMSFPPFFICRTLLRLHNIRAVILILICLTAGCEIGSFAMTRTNGEASSYGFESSMFFFTSIVSTAMLIRMIEVRKSRSGEWISLIIQSHKVAKAAVFSCHSGGRNKLDFDKISDCSGAFNEQNINYFHHRRIVAMTRDYTVSIWCSGVTFALIHR